MCSGLGIGGSWFQDPLNRGCSSPFCKMAEDSQPFWILGRGTRECGGSALCCFMNSDWFLQSVCCSFRIIVTVKILGKY